ncbi:hypothetical protein Mal15_21710 [Stieleria maiorica]|uniref:Uncharacterized protein n=1 Tax=Stieleria maiorica TaxID=2795974 RepID=A0A5B9MEV7_9BACT|nr:hypothetical protein Mal15_21710 [Stieleria maiorica]
MGRAGKELLACAASLSYRSSKRISSTKVDAESRFVVFSSQLRSDWSENLLVKKWEAGSSDRHRFSPHLLTNKVFDHPIFHSGSHRFAAAAIRTGNPIDTPSANGSHW